MAAQLSELERTMLVDAARRMLESAWPAERAMELAVEPAALKRISSELSNLGLHSLGATDGPGLGEALLVFEQLGRAACPAPLVGAFVANRLLDVQENKAGQEFLAAMQDGKATPAVALGRFDGDRFAGAARFASGRLSASLKFVEDIGASSHVLVFSGDPCGIAVTALDAAGVEAFADPGLGVPPLSAVRIDCEPLVWLPCDEAALADAAQLVRMLIAARALGAAQRAFDLALEHAKMRKQFGRVIGEFQAIQHKLADCFSRLDGVRLLLSSTADAHDRGDAAWTTFANAALAFAGPALRQLSLEVHHTLGAIGYAEEHEAPRHFRRIHADLARFGGAARARAGLADYLLSAAD